MADHKSKEYPYKWPDGTWHSKPKAAPTPAPAAKAPAPAAPAPPAPAAPGRVDPFLTADDLDAINQFSTDLQTKLEAIDTGLKNLETDTTYQKSQNEESAKKGTSAAQDDAISRGIFRSSIKDATLYDIEAQRSLASKFLDDKLTAARLSAGTQKQILATAKTNFDSNMLKRQASNAQGVNDANSAAYAAARSAWEAATQAAAPAAQPPGSPSSAKGKPAPLDQLGILKPVFAGTTKNGKPAPGTKVTTNKKTKTYFSGVTTA